MFLLSLMQSSSEPNNGVCSRDVTQAMLTNNQGILFMKKTCYLSLLFIFFSAATCANVDDLQKETQYALHGSDIASLAQDSGVLIEEGDGYKVTRHEKCPDIYMQRGCLKLTANNKGFLFVSYIGSFDMIALWSGAAMSSDNKLSNRAIDYLQEHKAYNELAEVVCLTSDVTIATQIISYLGLKGKTDNDVQITQLSSMAEQALEFLIENKAENDVIGMIARYINHANVAKQALAFLASQDARLDLERIARWANSNLACKLSNILLKKMH